jgi:hypothetical protein
VDSSHDGRFLFLGTTTSSTGSSGWSGSSLGCSSEHVLSSLGSSYYSSLLESMGSYMDFLKEKFSSKVTSLSISIFC